MIHGKSIDPVSLKKINLRLWTLSDEIESTIGHYLSPTYQATPAQLQETTIDEEFIKNFYEGHWENLSGSKSPATPTLAAVPAPLPEQDQQDQENKEQPPSPTPAPTLSLVPSEEQPPLSKTQDLWKHRANFKRQVPQSDCQGLGQLLLYDLNIEQLSFFCSKSFAPGQEIVVEFDIPRSFAIVAKVLSVKNYQFHGRIISSQQYCHRLFCKIEHRYPGDVSLLRQFLTAIDTRPL